MIEDEFYIYSRQFIILEKTKTEFYLIKKCHPRIL